MPLNWVKEVPPLLLMILAVPQTAQVPDLPLPMTSLMQSRPPVVKQLQTMQVLPIPTPYLDLLWMHLERLTF